MVDFDRFKVLSFDCYGTLIDWETGILQALRPVLRAHGVSAPEERLLEWFGEEESRIEAGEYLRYREVLGRVLERLGARMGFAPTDGEIEGFGGSVVDWPAFPDSAEALAKLKERYRLVILSNVDDDLFEGSRPKLGVEFDEVITAEQAGSYKPKPGHFELAARRVGVGKEEWLHVAQSLFHDIRPAREFGLATVWVNRRAGKEGGGATPPAEATPDLEVPDMATLAAMAAG